MSMQSLSASHQVSISHDPLEVRQSSSPGQGYGARDNGRGGGHRRDRDVSERASSMWPSMSAGDLRPVMLAGAIGLFAAWVVSGMNSPRARTDSRRGRRNVATDGEAQRYGDRPQPTRGPRDVYTAAGPEGRSSRKDFELDALNP